MIITYVVQRHECSKPERWSDIEDSSSLKTVKERFDWWCRYSDAGLRIIKRTVKTQVIGRPRKKIKFKT